MNLIAFAALALAALTRAGPSNVDFPGDDINVWRAVPPTEEIPTKPMTGPGCAGATARVLSPNQRLQLTFTGSDLVIYGIPVPGDVHVRWRLDKNERPPLLDEHVGLPEDACRRIYTFHNLEDRQHNLMIEIDAPSRPDRKVHMYIVNATATSSQQQPSNSQTEMPLPAPTSDPESTVTSGSNTILESPSTTSDPSSQATTSAMPPSTSTSTSGTSESSANASPSKSTFIIVGAVVGGVLLIALVGFGIYFYIRRQRLRIPPSAAFRARLARTEFVMVAGETSRSVTPFI